MSRGQPLSLRRLVVGSTVSDVNPPRVALGTVLVVTMASATFGFAVFGVLASELISHLGIERWQLGMLVSVATLGGGALSPAIGKWVDEIGGRRAVTTTLVLSAVVLVTLGVAPEFSLVVGAAFLTGLATAISNPATNKLISVETEPGRQGFIVGVKQTGSLVSAAIGGLFLPLFTDWWGWRWAVVAFAAVPLALGVPSMVRGVRPESAAPVFPEIGRKNRPGPTMDRLPGWIYRLTIYSFLMGAAITAVLTYLPLYAQEILGMTQGEAGRALSISGWVGIAGLVGWTRLAEGRFGAVRSLMVIACLGAGLGLVLAYGPQLGTWSIWLAGFLTGLSGSAWNAVCMLVAIQGLSGSLTGKGSGVMLAGALGGGGVGAPLLGWSVDHLGVYRPGWLGAAGFFVAALLVAATVRGERGLTRGVRRGG